MTEEEERAHEHALRAQLAERRALWAILQEIIGRGAKQSDAPSDVLDDLSKKIMERLDRKDEDAQRKGLDLQLAYVKDAVDRFFSELADRASKNDL